MTTWVCADCGTTYDEKVSPCTHCASERIARLEDETEPVSNDQSRGTEIEWRCTECGATHIKNNPPCNRCGSMSFEVVYDNTQSPNENTERAETNTESRSITLRKLTAYGFGILAVVNFTGALLYVSIIPLLFFLVAVYVSLPPARRHLRHRFNIEISTAAAAVIYAFTTLLGNIIFIANL